jgi:hypothetical protein
VKPDEKRGVSILRSRIGLKIHVANGLRGRVPGFEENAGLVFF